MTYTDETLAKAWLAGEHAGDCYVSNLFEAGNRTPKALADAIDDNAGRAAAMRAALAALSVRGKRRWWWWRLTRSSG